MRRLRLHGVRLERHRLSAGEVLVFLVVVYVMSALTVYRFRHPHFTETELLLHVFDALAWKTVGNGAAKGAAPPPADHQ